MSFLDCDKVLPPTQSKNQACPRFKPNSSLTGCNESRGWFPHPHGKCKEFNPKAKCKQPCAKPTGLPYESAK